MTVQLERIGDQYKVSKKSLYNEYDLSDRLAYPSEGDCPYTLFLGAGASITSGIPSAECMVETWRRQLQAHLLRKNEEDLTPDEKTGWFDPENPKAGNYEKWRSTQAKRHESEYSLLFSHFRGNRRERQLYIEKIVDRALPSFGYLYLASLIARNRIKCVVTTNFDDLVSDALFQFYRQRAVIVAFDSAVDSVRMNSLRPIIIKLHGDFLYDNLRNVGNELATLGSNMESKLLETAKDGGMIVVGYNGADECVMTPLNNMIRGDSHLRMGLHWCLFAPEGADLIPVPNRLATMYQNYPGRIFLYGIESFDYLMESMYRRCKAALPQQLLDPTNNTLYREFVNGINDNGQQPYLTAGMRADMKRFLVATVESKTSPDYVVDFADQLHKEANGALEKGEYRLASMHASDAMRLIAQALATEGVTPIVVARAHKRDSGLHLIVAEAQASLGESPDDSITKAFESVNRGRAAVASLPLEQQASSDWIGLPYNGICGFAILAKTRSLREEEKATCVGNFKEVLTKDTMKEELRALAKEYGMRECRIQIPEIDAKLPAPAGGKCRGEA